jgi:hypothetical protein
VKLEVDTRPPPGFDTEEKLLLWPFSFHVRSYQLGDLFAGKMHALLFRKWKQRVKGRDWYDMEWYIRRGTPLHLEHFVERARDSGDWKLKGMSQEQFIALVKKKISEVSFLRIKKDIIRFISNDKVLELWTSQYFCELTNLIRFE